MHSITTDSLSDLQNEYLQEGCNVLYGAGLTGRRFQAMLTDLGVRIDYFVDDSPAKVGTDVCGRRVLPFADMVKLSGKRRVNVIIATIYGNMVLGKLEHLPLHVFEAFGLYQKRYSESLAQTLTLKISKREWISKIQAVRAICDDDESQKVLGVYQEAVSKDIFDFVKIADIASCEDHYFVSQMREAMSKVGRPLRIVDCGAYVGDMLWQLEKWQIPFEKIYAYEASPDIFTQLEKNVKKQRLTDRTVLLPFACWDKETELLFDSNPGEDTAGAVSTAGGVKVLARRIDDTVKGSVDFLKTDIEGAERATLRGAEQTLLENRPLLAISIYHSLDDLVDLPLYLASLLDNYRWFIRHHSLIWCETVLYGVPE